MGLYYLAVIRKNLENKKKLTPVEIMNSANMTHKNIVSTFSIHNDSATVNNSFGEYCWYQQLFQGILSSRRVIPTHSVGSITPPKFPSSIQMYK